MLIYIKNSCSFLMLCLLLHSTAVAKLNPLKIDVISPPVNGTNLISKCLDLLSEPFGGWKPIQGPHLIASKKNIDFSLKNNRKIIFIIRDPRDRVVSYAYKIKKVKPKLTISIPALMLDVMNHYGKVHYDYLVRIPFYKNMGDFSEYYKMYFPWFEYPNLLIVSFENLVGEKAGGSSEKQLAEIRKIAEFLDIDASEEHIQYVSDNLWGGTASFRSPQIGIWKEFFTDKHKEAFKRTCMGQFLIDFGYETDLSW